MDKAALLCAKDDKLMRDFSRRSIEGLTGRTFVSISLPFFSSYVEANITKEVDKDRIMIEHAADLYAARRPVGPDDIGEVFEKSTLVDRRFVSEIAIPSLIIRLRYDDFADIRKQRIGITMQAVVTCLTKWDDEASFEIAVRRSFRPDAFLNTLTEILRLYSLETRKLSGSLRFLPPLSTAMSMFMEALYDSMDAVSGSVVEDCGRSIYPDAGQYLPAPGRGVCWKR